MSNRRRFKPLRVLAGTLLMAGFVLLALYILTRFAGGWGVPYFSFTSERGTRCVNNLTGYTCSPINLADVEFFGDIDLPDDSRVLSGTYRSTHDYQLDAVVEVPKAGAAVALKRLNQAFGSCSPDHPSPLDPTGLKKICVLANDDNLASGDELESRLYTIGTGLKPDGTRVIAFLIKSR